MPVSNIPFGRNPFFTGREALLAQIHLGLQASYGSAFSQPQAISGLGGIGKTQIAIEYAYQHYQDYQAIFWTRADSREALVSGYVAITKLLNLPEKNVQDQEMAVQAVLQWLTTHTQWLLILDNADDLAIIREFLPPRFGGHLLLTTRAQAMGRLAHRLEVATMEQNIGALFLLRRAGLIARDALLKAALPADRVRAKEIAEELGGLPLALDQAGAYIEETQGNLADYQSCYSTRKSELLKRRGGLIDDHPEPVATTWSLSFEKVEQRNPAAADLLRFCAFLHPDAIPEKMIIAGAEHLIVPLRTFADLFALNEAITILSNYSLVKRDPIEKLLSVHRLIQVVIKDEMKGEVQRHWEAQALQTINFSFPRDEEPPWFHSQRCLSHALVCIDFFNQQKKNSPEVAELLHKVGVYLLNREQFEEAESYLQRALERREQILGANHPDTAQTLNHLGILYGDRGKYEQAESFYQRALEIRERILGANHPDTATSLNNLATRYRDQGKHKLAESYFLRSLAIDEQVRGADHPYVAVTCNNLALLYYKQGQYSKAEPLFQRALKIREKKYGVDHPYTAQTYKGLANLYRDQGKYEEAESLYQRALAVIEQSAGKNHSDVGAILNNWATLYRKQDKYAQAEPLYRRALAIQERALGVDHPRISQVLSNLATCYYKQGKYEQAEPLYQRALELREHAKVADEYTAITFNNLAELYSNQGKYEQAEPLYQRALHIYEQVRGPKHIKTQRARKNYVSLLRTMGRDEEAKKIEKGDSSMDQ